mmetsp:Transcript_49061/g.110337  ORF Transcript_49061/g.110337 Transcript_49061/m.110337 type:complete len:435 (-) Transcript_49061:1839-3143(-)
MLLVNLEEPAEVLPGVRAAKAIGAEHNVVAANPGGDELGVGSHVVRDGNGDAAVAEALADPRSLLLSAQTRGAVALDGIAVELAVAGGTPDLRTNAELRQHVNGIQGLLHDGTRPDEADSVLRGLGILELVESLDDALIHTRGLGRHGKVLVVGRHVVDDVPVLAPHLLHAMLHDCRHLIAECRIPALDRGAGQGNEQGVAVLVLQALAVQCCAAVGGPDEETTSSHVRSLPDAIAHALEAKHGVVDEEGEGWRLLGSVGCGRGNPRHDGATLADALLQDLSVGGLGILHHLVGIDRRVVLPEGSVDLEDREECVQAEGSGLIGDHQRDALAKLSRLHHLAENLRKIHCGAHLAALGALVEHPEGLLVGRELNQGRDRGWLPGGQEAAQRYSPVPGVLDLFGVLAGINDVLGVGDLQLIICELDAQGVAETLHV